MANVKGSAISARVSYVRERHPEVWPRFLAALDAPTRAIAEGTILKSAWYPFESFVALNVVADQLLGQGDLKIVREIGRYAASANLPTVYRIFYRLGSPEFIINRAAALWQVHYDSGEAKAIEIRPGLAHFEVLRFVTPHPAHCRSVEGFMERSLELTGARGVRVTETACAARGDALCRFQAEWIAT
jgi:hypothetical protein